jgi:hypothetical protein
MRSRPLQHPIHYVCNYCCRKGKGGGGTGLDDVHVRYNDGINSVDVAVAPLNRFLTVGRHVVCRQNRYHHSIGHKRYPNPLSTIVLDATRGLVFSVGHDIALV